MSAAPQPSPTLALVVAAGRGVRIGGEVPKQYILLAGTPVLRRTLATLMQHPRVDHVAVIINDADRVLYAQCVAEWAGGTKLLPAIIGGATRQASVRAGLEAVAALSPAHVIIHDGVRPFAPPALFDSTLDALAASDGAIAALAVTDTLKRGTAGGVSGTLDRSGLFAAQTPQAFRFAPLLAAHRAAQTAKREDFTDDAALLEWQGRAVALVAGHGDNSKLTTPEDFARAAALLGGASTGETRTGIGYDVHQFTTGDHVMLAGVRIPHSHGVFAHSDGDVALHALTDAVLGAIGDGDIGTHFPPSDPAWRGASSDRFLAHAAGQVRARGGVIVNLDVTIVTEAPRVGPHREAMRTAVAAAAGISPDRVSLKATTSEKMGFIGRREGLAALAIATIRLP